MYIPAATSKCMIKLVDFTKIVCKTVASFLQRASGKRSSAGPGPSMPFCSDILPSPELDSAGTFFSSSLQPTTCQSPCAVGGA